MRFRDQNSLYGAAVSGDESELRKGLKAGWDINHCRWTKLPSHLNIPWGARTIPDILVARHSHRVVLEAIEQGADLTGARARDFVERKPISAQREYSAEQIKDPEFLEWSTPLHIAGMAGRRDMVELLLVKGLCDPNVKDCRGQTPLHAIVVTTRRANKIRASGLLGCIKFLLANNADINCSDTSGESTLALAVRLQNQEICKLLVQHGADVNWISTSGATPLGAAARLSNRSIFRTLYDAGGRMESLIEEYGASHFFGVLAAKRPELLQSIVLSMPAGLQIDEPDHTGMTAFFRAASYCDPDALRALADLGADIETRDPNGCTVLMRAVMAGNLAIISTMLDLGADINATDVDGWTPLDAAMLRPDGASAERLLPHGAIPGVQRLGDGLLHRAAMLGTTHVVRYILERYRGVEPPVDLDPVDQNGVTPLALAASYNNHAVLRLLITNAADPLRPDVKGHPPIERAMYWGSVAAVRILLDHGALVGDQTVTALQCGARDRPSSRIHYKLIARMLRSMNITVDLDECPNGQYDFAEAFQREYGVDMMRIRMAEKQGKTDEHQTQPDSVLGNTSNLSESKDPFEKYIAGGNAWVDGLSIVLE